MIYVTGDMHREFSRLYTLYGTEEDMLIVLGDAGINFFLDESDVELKKYLSSFGLKFFCIRGNHEERPENISTYREVEMFGGKVYIEDQFPNLIFAKDGEIYEIGGYRVLVIGGAYSIDKRHRLKTGKKWFRDEQLTDDEMLTILDKVKGQHFDIVLTHTCPRKYEPTEVFLDWVNQDRVDKSMENFLGEVEECIDYDKWYCGHYHTEKALDKIQFMFKDIEVFNKEIKKPYSLGRIKK